MAPNQLQRYLDAGMQLTAVTKERAEEIVRELVKAGEVRAEAAQAAVSDLVERSRKNRETLLEQVRAEVHKQVATAELVTKDVVSRLQAQVDELRSQLASGNRLGRRAKKSAVTQKTTASKAAARKAPAKKAAATKAPAKKKAAVKRAPAKKAAAKKSAPRTANPGA